ncbi:hypothetical protein [Klebsiella grimontii]|uniref:hypothetical protein n=1 Tax=Klebsiella grimontii TaxID=2058152 RepID=UPI0022446C5A|nr:hypothetical protein [Klebsiella grimontii]
MAFSRLALRLAGLRVHSSLRAGSPDRRASAASGNGIGVMNRRGFFPARAALTGLRVHSSLRAGSPDKARQRRLREHDWH